MKCVSPRKVGTELSNQGRKTPSPLKTTEEPGLVRKAVNAPTEQELLRRKYRGNS